MTQTETKPNETKPVKTKPNQVKTNSVVLIPVELFYTRFSDLIDGDAQKASMKNDGALIAVDVEKVQEVTK